MNSLDFQPPLSQCLGPSRGERCASGGGRVSFTERDWKAENRGMGRVTGLPSHPLPYIQASYSGVVLSAYTYHKPVVESGVGGIREMLRKQPLSSAPQSRQRARSSICVDRLIIPTSTVSQRGDACQC
jgi:hypothetical protein